MAVHYDKETDSTITWIGKIKNALKGISPEADRTFKLLGQMSDIEFDKLVDNNFEEFIKENELADKSLITFLSDVNNYGKKNLANYQQYLKDTNQTTSLFSSYTSKAVGVVKSFVTSLASMGVNMAIGIGFESLYKGLDYLINYEEKQKEVFEKAKSATEEAAKSILDLKSKMSDTSTKTSELSAKFANLVQGVNPLTNENKSLSTEQYEEFLDVNNQLAELFPSLTHNYDENGNAILGLSGDVDTVTA